MTIQLQGAGLVLRQFLPEDLPAVVRAFEDPLIVRWNPGPAGSDPEAAAAEWMRVRNDWSDHSHVSWAVVAPGEFLGSVSVHKIDAEQADGEVGYWLAPTARGRGYAAAAVRLASAHAFTELGMHRLQLFHAVENVASCRVAAAAGFLLEGVLRQSYRYPAGEYHDEHLHARLAADPS